MLAREAAVSKATLYRHFENMADVLRCVTEAETEKFRETTPPKTMTLADLHAALTQYCTKLLEFLNASDTLEFSRLIHEEARDNSALGRTFFNAAYGQTQKDFAKMFAAAQSTGVVSDATDPMDIAEDLIGLLEGLGMVRAQLGVADVPFPEVSKRSERAISTILNMHVVKTDDHEPHSEDQSA